MSMQIPKTLHYVWLGPKPMHPLMKDWQDKFRRMHPDWRLCVWRESPDLPLHMLLCDGQIVECRCPEFLSSCPTYSKRSDVWRYEILEQLGGVYLDTDFEPVKPLDGLLDGVTAFAGLCQTKYGWDDACPEGKTKLEVGCSIMGCVPHHPWLTDLVKLTPYQSPTEQLALAFPFLTDVTARHPDVVIFPTDVFYPVSWADYALKGRSNLRKQQLPATTYAVHRWSSCWYPDSLRDLKRA
jgi:inositol phosphorylceramide mannosyltransferase catalytic subunit